MSNIVNLTGGTRTYRDTHIDVSWDEEDYSKNSGLQFTDSALGITIENSDSGGMNEAVANSYDELVTKMKTENVKKSLKKTYQWNTKNKSFIQLHKDLETLGIKNNKFMLRLYDATLLDFDPYDVVVPLEIQARIIRECIINPWYFLREVARIPTDGTAIVPGGGVPFEIDRNSAATWFCFINGIDHYSSKPRQKGKTMDALAKINWAYHFGSISGNFTLGNKDMSLNKLNLSRLKTQRDLLPLWMQMRTVIDFTTLKIEKERSNVTSMRNPITKNTITLLPTASTESKADGIGRGYTSTIQMWDEFDWTMNNTRIIKASVFAFNTASANAKKHNSAYGRIFTSTPGNMDTKEGREADLFINGRHDDKENVPGMLKWTDSMFDKPVSEIRKIISSKSYNGIMFIEHSWQQLKCSIDWYEKACQGVSYDPEQIAREICLKRLRGSNKSPFTRQQIMQLCNNVEIPIDSVDYSDNYAPISFYEVLDKRVPYIMGVDTAEGLGSDNMAMVLINPYTEKVAAEFASPNINQSKMGAMVIRFMTKYCPKALIVPENNRGREFIHIIQESIFSDRLWIDADKFGEKEKINPSNVVMRDRAIGFNTNTHTRPMVLGVIGELVKNEPEKVNSKLVVDDVCSLEKDLKHDGKIAAAPGKHDDVIMAFGIAHTVFRFATNLEEWGITRGMIPPEQINKKSPEYIISKMKELMEMLPDNMKAMFNMDKNEVSDAFEYGKKINKYMNESRVKDVVDHGGDITDLEPEIIRQYNSESAYDSFVDDIVSMNDIPGNSDNGFDINDYL